MRNLFRIADFTHILDGQRMKRSARVALVVTGLVFGACSHAPPPTPPSAAVTAAPQSAAAETLKPLSGVVFVGCGFLTVENHGATHFTALLPAKQAHQIDKNGTTFLLDDVVVETHSTTARALGVPDLRNRALLLKHMDWEADYLAGLPGWRGLKRPEVGNIAPSTPFPVLAWLVQSTGDVEFLGQKIGGLFYVTAAIDDVVFILASPVRSSRDINAAGPVMERILRTLHETPGPTDLLAVSAKVRDQPGSWPDCASAD